MSLLLLEPSVIVVDIEVDAVVVSVVVALVFDVLLIELEPSLLEPPSPVVALPPSLPHAAAVTITTNHRNRIAIDLHGANLRRRSDAITPSSARDSTRAAVARAARLAAAGAALGQHARRRGRPQRRAR
ncbi:MAG: hypothetical protein K1X88_26250, partial [Nannocystaceae bacterium]|nr:hypothetical protein [Nannocystaceae bacterium]